MGELSSRLSTLDRLLADSDDVVVIGPLDLPPLEALRAAAVQLAVAVPEARLTQVLDPAAGRWVSRQLPLDQLGEVLVVEAPELAPAADGALPFGDLARGVARFRPPPVPVVWVVAGDWLLMAVSHALGDAGLINRLATGLVATALSGSPAGEPASTRNTAHPLLRAVLHHYGRRPSRALTTLSARRRTKAGADALVELPDGDAGPPTATHAVTSPEAAAALKAWQREHAPAVTPLAVQTLLAHRALAAVGLDPLARALVLYDVRAYLPSGLDTRGNFAVGVSITVDDHPADAAMRPLLEVEAAIREGFEAGRPLSALVAGQIKQRLGRVEELRRRRRASPRAGAPARGQAPPAAPGAPGRAAPRPLLVMTSLGRNPQVEALPFREDRADPVFSALNRPAAGEVTVAATFLRGRRQFSLSFDPVDFDAQRMQRAVDLVAHEPVALLSGTAPR